MLNILKSLIAIVTLGCFLTACGSSNNPPPAPTAEVATATRSSNSESRELIIWGGDPLIKAEFEKKYPDIKVTMVDKGWDQELYQNLINAIQLGTPPDLVIGESYFQTLAAAGQVMPIDDVMADIKADLIPGTYKGAEYNGQVHGLAFFTGVFGLERNCDVIKQAGLDCDTPPTTWDELLTQVKTITEKGAGKYHGFSLQGPVGPTTGGIFRMSVFLNQADALICRNNCAEPFFNNPKTIPVLEFLRQLNQYTPPGLTTNREEGQVYTPLFEGKSAYQIAGSWHPKWAKDTGCKDCRYSTVPIPTGGHEAGVVVGNVIYAIPTQAQHPEWAKNWLKVMVSAAVQEQLFATSGRLPTTRSALTKLRPTVDSATQLFIDELLNNASLAVLPQWKQEPLKTWKVYNDQVLMPVLTTKQPIQEIIEQAQVQAEKIGP